MKLQKRTAIVFILLLIGLLLICSLFISTLTIASYTSLERQYLAKDLDQAITKLEDEKNTLSTIVSDWGPWDDTYQFVNGEKPDFIEANLLPETYHNLNLNLIVITNRKGDIVYSGFYDLVNNKEEPVPDFIISRINPANPLLNMTDPRQAISGILMLPSYPMLVASRPVVHTDFSGESQGVVIMGRYLDEDETGRLAKLTQPSLAFFRLDDPDQPRDLVLRIRGEDPASLTLVEPVDNNQIRGYAVIRDLYGADALVLHITEPRDIYRQGMNTTLTFILIILGTGLCFGLIIIILLNRFVLSRLGNLSLQVHSIGDYRSLDKRVDIGGDDEFSGLAEQINLMLDTLKKAQQGLLASETRFRELSELLPQVIFEMDLTGKILYVNKAGAEQFGISEKKMADGISIRNFVLPENYQQLEQGLAKVMAGERSPGDVYTLKRPDGTIMKAIATTSLIHRDGQIAGFRGIIIDVTERIRLEQELEESTKLLSGILQASPVGVFKLDSAGYVTFINETFTKITGIPIESMRGKYWADILPEEERNRVLTDLAESIKERRTSRAEMRYIHPDGTLYWLFGQTVPIFDKAGSLTSWVGTITDMTGQKLAEDALRESEEKYRALTENTPDILFSADMNGILTYASPQVSRYGYLVDELVGQHLSKFIHPQDFPQVETNLAREMKEGAQFLSRFRILDKWGTPHWFEEKSTLRLDLNGKPIGIYGILRDVTERKRVEDAIEIANKKLNLMNQITRHDILNTITGLYGCVDMAKATTSPEEKEQLLDDIRNLTKVIQRHITFTRQYQEVGVHLPQWQNVNELITRVVQNFEKSGIIFASEFEKTEVFADPMLEKVFYNLVDNAIRYGKKITTISIYPKISDRGFAIVFEDDGVGVPEMEKREIFKHGVGMHTGLGLFLTAEILSITGITIEENGVFGKGARFVIRIPIGTWRFPGK